MKKRFLLPWEKRYAITCPKCNGRIETPPLWFWQKKPENMGELQRLFCHAIDSEFLDKIPTLTENDWKSKQKWEEFRKEFVDDFGRIKPWDEVKPLFIIQGDVLPEIFSKHGIFSLIQFLTETEVTAVLLLLGVNRRHAVKQTFFQQTMDVSRSYVSTILKNLRKWRVIKAYKLLGKGKVSGRQLVYMLTEDAYAILDRDMQNYDFFRQAVIETVISAAEKFPLLAWRDDILKEAQGRKQCENKYN